MWYRAPPQSVTTWQVRPVLSCHCCSSSVIFLRRASAACAGVIESLTAIAERLGVRFMYDAPAERIEHDGKRATGVVLKDGRKLEADVIVVNADLPYAYRELLKDEREARKLDKKKFTCSAIMFY
jgi:phytoene dehydrogenase-like protein